MIRKWFLVPDSLREKQFVNELRQLHRAIASSKKFIDTYVILPTTDCNARCYYCLENNLHRQSMSDETARATAQYIIRASKGHSVTLRWFGGEPLFNIAAIDGIVAELSKQCVEFRSEMISNGYFLTQDISRCAVEKWRLQHVQIAVDGTEPVYNRRKAYRNACENPFQRVLDNIGHALDVGITVTIRLNLDKGNADDLLNVLDVLAVRFAHKKGCRINIQYLQSFTTSVIEFSDGFSAAEAYFKLVGKARDLGLPVLSGLPQPMYINKCMADNDACVVILPNGEIGKCEHFSDKELVGSVYENKLNAEKVNAWKEERHDIPECESCPLYPLCINLKKCERTKHGCSEVYRTLRIERIKDQMKAEYQRLR